MEQGAQEQLQMATLWRKVLQSKQPRHSSMMPPGPETRPRQI